MFGLIWIYRDRNPSNPVVLYLQAAFGRSLSWPLTFAFLWMTDNITSSLIHPEKMTLRILCGMSKFPRWVVWESGNNSLVKISAMSCIPVFVKNVPISAIQIVRQKISNGVLLCRGGERFPQLSCTLTFVPKCLWESKDKSPYDREIFNGLWL